MSANGYSQSTVRYRKWSLAFDNSMPCEIYSTQLHGLAQPLVSQAHWMNWIAVRNCARKRHESCHPQTSSALSIRSPFFHSGLVNLHAAATRSDESAQVLPLERNCRLSCCQQEAAWLHGAERPDTFTLSRLSSCHWISQFRSSCLAKVQFFCILLHIAAWQYNLLCILTEGGPTTICGGRPCRAISNML